MAARCHHEKCGDAHRGARDGCQPQPEQQGIYRDIQEYLRIYSDIADFPLFSKIFWCRDRPLIYFIILRDGRGTGFPLKSARFGEIIGGILCLTYSGPYLFHFFLPMELL